MMIEARFAANWLGDAPFRMPSADGGGQCRNRAHTTKMNCNPALGQYYAERALEYERVYTKPERQSDHTSLHKMVAEFSDERRVLEVACGTGYWTHTAATTAA